MLASAICQIAAQHNANDTVNTLDNVMVYGSRHDFGAKNSQMSAVEIPMAQVRTLPSIFGETDVMKALQTIPGVQQVSDGNAGIYVRGGNYDNTCSMLLECNVDDSPLISARLATIDGLSLH